MHMFQSRVITLRIYKTHGVKYIVRMDRANKQHITINGKTLTHLRQHGIFMINIYYSFFEMLYKYFIHI